jgi:outer membrane receptor for ferrienterochelin and colicin
MLRCFSKTRKVLAASILLALAGQAAAQQTSSGVGGLVVDGSNAPVAGAEVTITHIESGTVSHVVTDDSGRYIARGLRVGGPYTITVNKDGVGSDVEDDVYLDLNTVSTINAALGAGGVETIVVTGVAASSVFNKGVGTALSGRELEVAPMGNRALDDVARFDPRITVTDQAEGAISVAGVNNRYNNISVDGMSQGDPFGLNANGMPYVGSPISVDTIAAYDIKVSDYDVAQDAVGAAINAVTKSGTNDFHGSIYTAYRDAGSMVGERDGKDYAAFGTDETKGMTLGGPILKDRLFFFGAYEEQEVTEFGGAASGDGFTSGIITQQMIDEVVQVARDKYNFDAGSYGALGVNMENKRYLAKLDWNINDQHRAAFTYQKTEEFLPQPYDGTSTGVILSTRWYDKDNLTENYSLQLFSDWSDSFTTEAKVSLQTFDQINGNALDLPAINISAGTNSPTSGTGIRFGEDRNRHENKINTEKLSVSLFGTWYVDAHEVKFGFDYMKNDVLNLYGRDLHGVYTFRSVEEFMSGDYYRYDVRRPVAGFTEADTAAALVYTQYSPFIQDTWQVNDNLSLTYGVRVNIPGADKAPPRKPGFEETFGFPNDYKLGSSNKVILPRFAFNYNFDNASLSQLRGGIGLFQSVPPFVWLANPYQNNGVASAAFCASQIENIGGGCTFDTSGTYPFSADPYNQPFPANASVDGVRAQMDTIDPNFKLPSVWKFSLGYNQELPWMGLMGTAEIQHIRNKDGAFYKALNIGTPNGRLADGRDSYWVTMGGSAKNNGADPSITTNSTYLTNTDKGASTALTLSLDKPLSDSGWYGNISYTYTDATEVGSDSSSQAFSSYQYVSRLNPNEEIAKTATREIENSFKISLGKEMSFFGDYKTSFTAYYNGHDGLPYTWIINGDPNGDGIFQDPAYIPLIDDAKVSYVIGTGATAPAATPEQIAAFQAFIADSDYLSSHRGEIADRNEDTMPWVNQLDVGIQQEVPGFMSDHRGILRLDIYNFLNLLNEDWGVTQNVGGFDTRYMAGLNRVNADGTYVYNIAPSAMQTLSVYDFKAGYPSRPVSRWSLLVTLKYQF